MYLLCMAGQYDGKIVLAHRGQCRFDKKAFFAQEAGARLLLVTEVDDLPLQRIGTNYVYPVHIFMEIANE